MKFLYFLLLVTMIISCGKNGSDGATGEDGKDRGTWYNGTGEPNNAIGNDDDLFLDDQSGNFYKKISSVWVIQGNILGPEGNKGIKGDSGSKGETGISGINGISNTIKSEVICEDIVPGHPIYKFWYYATTFATGDIYASAVIYDDEDQYGHNSRFYSNSHIDVLTAPITIYFDKQQNDNWGHYKISANRLTLNYTVEYFDSTDGNENYTVSSKCTKTTY